MACCHIPRMFYYKLERQTEWKGHEDCWPLMKHNRQRPRHQALQVIKTPGENTVNKKAARQEMEETRKKKRSVQSSKINKHKKRGVNKGHDAHKINLTQLVLQEEPIESRCCQEWQVAKGWQKVVVWFGRHMGRATCSVAFRMHAARFRLGSGFVELRALHKDVWAVGLFAQCASVVIMCCYLYITRVWHYNVFAYEIATASRNNSSAELHLHKRGMNATNKIAA